ncbi:small nuclear ribonucleoprotein [Blastomyces dermatitidis ER-3]|uniref:Small nuclear ribonucleoprotein n=1 Tax=Ajellomyces dermatitidis (strain ER-3 / ATCC MYA-2586) TaxID=559297 RepID=A0ABP2EZP6_AJEDR|nr:small nuclear ribonucleoprotein [Blastomyces dermatitidis ER-3]EEQ89778.1 small nuclear ribonucleoprotein [Blastomyces dermatitidis ER-3]
MSERSSFRGGPRGGGGGRGGGRAGGGIGGYGYRSHRGGGGGASYQQQQQQSGGVQGGQGWQQGQQQQQQEKPKKENILDLTKYMEKEVCVKFNGGREVTGTLKGYDQLMNLVLDDVKETMRDDEGNQTTRSLGLIVARGTLLVLISPVDGSEEIANPFLQAEDE